MLDQDLAEMYSVKTKQLKRQVKRNIDRFPKGFMFTLTAKEFENLRSQIGTSSWGCTRYMPMAFTEQGVKKRIVREDPNKANGRSAYNQPEQLFYPIITLLRRVLFLCNNLKSTPILPALRK
jgi:hypothetical protein